MDELQHALAEYLGACGRLYGLISLPPPVCHACGGVGYRQEERIEFEKPSSWIISCEVCKSAGWDPGVLALTTLFQEANLLGSKTRQALEDYRARLQGRPRAR